MGSVGSGVSVRVAGCELGGTLVILEPFVILEPLVIQPLVLKPSFVESPYDWTLAFPNDEPQTRSSPYRSSPSRTSHVALDRVAWMRSAACFGFVHEREE